MEKDCGYWNYSNLLCPFRRKQTLRILANYAQPYPQCGRDGRRVCHFFRRVGNGALYRPAARFDNTRRGRTLTQHLAVPFDKDIHDIPELDEVWKQEINCLKNWLCWALSLELPNMPTSPSNMPNITVCTAWFMLFPLSRPVSALGALLKAERITAINKKPSSNSSTACLIWICMMM